VRAIGTNAIPWLLSELDGHDRTLKRRVNRLADMHRWIPYLGIKDETRHWRAAFGFCLIGPLGRNAIPELVQRMGKDQDVRQGSIEIALAGLAHRGIAFQTDFLLPIKPEWL